MKNENDNLPSILKQIQHYQNQYIYYKDHGEPLEIAKIMWDIGDYLLKQGVKNPHALGWEAERQKAFIKRPLVFRSFVVRRIWDSKEKLSVDLFGLKSVNSLIEFFPFLDQNDKWKVPDEEISALLNILNTKSAKEFDKELKKVKQKYIGIKNNRQKYLKDYSTVQTKFYQILNKLNKMMKESEPSECVKFSNVIGRDVLKELGRICLHIATKQDIEKRLNIESNDEEIKELLELLRESGSSAEKVNRLRRVIDPNDMIKLTDICNSIQNEKTVEEYRLREKFTLSVR